MTIRDGRRALIDLGPCRPATTRTVVHGSFATPAPLTPRPASSARGEALLAAQREWKRAWREAHLELARAQGRERQRRYYQAHREELREYRAAWRAARRAA